MLRANLPFCFLSEREGFWMHREQRVSRHKAEDELQWALLIYLLC